MLLSPWTACWFFWYGKRRHSPGRPPKWVQLLLEKGTDEYCDPTAESSNVCDPVDVPDVSRGDPGGLPAESCCEPGTVAMSAASCCDPDTVPAESCCVPGAQADASSKEPALLSSPAESCCEPGTVGMSAASCCDPDTVPAESCCVPGAKADVSNGEPAHLSFEFDQPFKFDLNLGEPVSAKHKEPTSLTFQFDHLPFSFDLGEHSPPGSEISKLAGQTLDENSDVSETDSEVQLEARVQPERHRGNSRVQPRDGNPRRDGGEQPRRPNTRYPLRARTRGPARLMRLEVQLGTSCLERGE